MKKNITKAGSKTDYKRLSGMKDSEINYSDIPELDEAFFRNAKIVLPDVDYV